MAYLEDNLKKNSKFIVDSAKYFLSKIDTMSRKKWMATKIYKKF